MQFAPHQPTDEQPVPEQWSPDKYAQMFMLRMMPNGVEYPFHPLGPSIVAVYIPDTWLNSRGWEWTGRGVWQAEETLASCKHCTAKTETLYYQHHFQEKSKMQSHATFQDQFQPWPVRDRGQIGPVLNFSYHT